jgi:hypothetical protein
MLGGKLRIRAAVREFDGRIMIRIRRMICLPGANFSVMNL